jgi:hypothetical protein
MSKKNLKLEKTTLLRILPHPNFQDVDTVLKEIEQKAELSKLCSQTRIIETQTVETQTADSMLPTNGGQFLEGKNYDDYYTAYEASDMCPLIQPIGPSRVKFSCSIQYQNEGELFKAVGDIWNRSQENIPLQKTPSNQTSVSSPNSLDTSLETQQLNRLISLAEWRRSLIRSHL